MRAAGALVEQEEDAGLRRRWVGLLRLGHVGREQAAEVVFHIVRSVNLLRRVDSMGPARMRPSSARAMGECC
ncbi:MAG: hypothetical protein AMXMBFR80_16900 [Dehalococcoidia bacterium]